MIGRTGLRAGPWIRLTCALALSIMATLSAGRRRWSACRHLPHDLNLSQGAVGGSITASPDEIDALEASLQQLHPWRKGPFNWGPFTSIPSGGPIGNGIALHRPWATSAANAFWTLGAATDISAGVCWALARQRSWASIRPYCSACSIGQFSAFLNTLVIGCCPGH